MDTWNTTQWRLRSPVLLNLAFSTIIWQVQHLTQTYSSDCHHRCHHDMGLLFSLARGVPLRELPVLPADENMAVWHAAILSKIDNQQPHSQVLSSLPSLVAPCGKSLSARLDDQMCLTIYKLARVLGLSWNGKLTASTMYTEACRVSVTCRENDAKILQHTAGYGRYSSKK